MTNMVTMRRLCTESVARTGVVGKFSVDVKKNSYNNSNNNNNNKEPTSANRQNYS